MCHCVASHIHVWRQSEGADGKLVEGGGAGSGGSGHFQLSASLWAPIKTCTVAFLRGTYESFGRTEKP